MLKLRGELDITSKQLKAYQDMEKDDNPAFTAILIEKAHKCLKRNNHLLWKILQEKLGTRWFQTVFLDRDQNARYCIDYDPLEEILPKLNKMYIKDNPEKLDMLAGENGEFIRCVVETFYELKKNLEGELLKREFYWKDVLKKGDDPDRIPAPETKPNPEAPKTAEKRAEAADQALVALHKRRTNMILAELHNTKNDLLAVQNGMAIVEMRNEFLLGVIKETFAKVGLETDGTNLERCLTRLKKVDGDTLRANGLEKALLARKVDLVCKCVIHVS
jgi:hypothetical protein